MAKGWGAEAWGSGPFGAQSTSNQAITAVGIASAQAFGTPKFIGQVVPTGIPSAEAFGTPRIDESIAGTGIPTTEAFGSPQVNLQISPTGIASAQAFGTPSVNESVLSTGIPSAQAFGTPIVAGPLTVPGISSTEAFGTPNFTYVIGPSSITSAEAFGTPLISEEVDGTGIPSAEAFGTPNFGAALQPTAIASVEVFGTPQLNLRIDPTGVASAEAFGTPKFGEVVTGTGIPSAETFGTPIISGPIGVTGIPSAEAFGTATVIGIVSPMGIPSAEAFGVPVVAYSLTIAPTGIPSGEVVSIPVVLHDGGQLRGTSGSTTGGDLVRIVNATDIGMEEVQDSFADGLLNLGLWTPTTAGSGYLIEVPGAPRGSLQLATGRTGASAASVRFAGTPHVRFDVETEVRLTSSLRSGGGQASFYLSTYLSAVSFCRASLDLSGPTKVLHVLSVDGGQTLADISIPLTSVSSARIRLLRAGERVYVFLNQALLCVVQWTNIPALFEFGVSNDALGLASMTASVVRFTRNPVILFGAEPMREVLLLSRGRLDGYTPPVGQQGTVPVHVEAYTAEYNLDQMFTYQNPVNFRTVGNDGTSSLTTLSDTAVRN